MLLCAAGAGPFGNTASRRFCTKAHGFPDAKGGIKMAPKAPTSPAQRYYITPEGGSPQPVREASAGPGQNPWRPGPKARRRHQPSPAKAGVNLREYWKAPPRSRPRPRHRRLNPQAPKWALNLREYSFPRQSPFILSISASCPALRKGCLFLFPALP